MGQKDLVITLMLISIFSLALINYSIKFGIDNSAPINIANDSDLSDFSTTTGSELITYSVEINGTSRAFQESEVTDASDTTKTGTTFKEKENSPINAFKTIMQLGYQKIFGGGESFYPVFALVIATVVFIGIVYAWKTWKGGNPE